MLGNSIVSLLFTLTSQHGEMRICVHTSTEIRTHDPRASAACVLDSMRYKILCAP